MSKLTENLYTQIEKINCKAKKISTKNLSQLIREIQESHSNGMFEESFFKRSLSWIKISLMDKLQDAKSVIIVAIPSPQSKANFKWKEKIHSLIIPPHYADYEQSQEKIEKIIKKLLKEENYFTKRLRFPLKTLAVRSGLGEYGKNNICYVPGMGSHLQLIAISTNMPSKKTIQEPKIMDLCKTCNLCQKACPTKAISQNRFLLYGERCLTYHNEKKADIPFPGWMKKSWHNSIVGCIFCQKICPANKKFTNWTGREENFAENETIALLNSTSLNDLNSSTIEKLKRLGLDYYFDSLSRNLSILIEE